MAPSLQVSDKEGVWHWVSVRESISTQSGSLFIGVGRTGEIWRMCLATSPSRLCGRTQG